MGWRRDDVWADNASQWIRVIRSGAKSTRLVTDSVLLKAIRAPQDALIVDAGCGEGALTRALRGKGYRDIISYDATRSLIHAARQRDPAGCYLIASHRGISSYLKHLPRRPAAIVFNFSLFSRSDFLDALATLKAVGSDGEIIIQTLPLTAVKRQVRNERFRDWQGQWRGVRYEEVTSAWVNNRSLELGARRCTFYTVRARGRQVSTLVRVAPSSSR